MEIEGRNITIGADPEIFVGRNGKFEVATGLVPGSKADPYKVKHGAIQVDGMALEFNIDPAENYDEFQRNLDTVQGILGEYIEDREFLSCASVHFDEMFLEQAPREAVILGCSADYNAYTHDVNPSPMASALMRTAGGHLHLGVPDLVDCTRAQRQRGGERLVRLMDREVGVYSLLWDDDDQRRSLYGLAGSYRTKPFGVEYRTLSNKWLFNKNITRFVYNASMRAVTAFLRGEDVDTDLYRDIINYSDRDNSFFKDNFNAEYIKSLEGRDAA